MTDETSPSTAPSTEPVMHLIGAGGVQIEASTILNAIKQLTEEVN